MRVPAHPGARIAGLLVGLLLVQGLVWIGFRAWEARREADAPSLRFERVGGRVPVSPFVLERADGTRFTVTPGKEGEAILVHFWATWCPPCREELPALLALGRRFSPAGRLRILAVAADPGWDDLRRFFDGNPPAEIFRDHSGSARTVFRVSDLPDTYLVTADGLLRLRFAGAQAWQTKNAPQILAREAANASRSDLR